MLRIGLTGGIGSGKSTVAQMLAERGFVIIDADAISRQLTAPGGAAMGAIVARFGHLALSSDGGMDRVWMRAQVLGSAALRSELEAIIHPLVHAQTLVQSHDAVRQGRTTLVFDIPLLVESGRWRSQLDRVVVVDCTEAMQIERVVARESGRAGWSATAVQRMIEGQATRQARLAAADICIFNQGISLAALQGLVRQLAKGFGL